MTGKPKSQKSPNVVSQNHQKSPYVASQNRQMWQLQNKLQFQTE